MFIELNIIDINGKTALVNLNINNIVFFRKFNPEKGERQLKEGEENTAIFTQTKMMVASEGPELVQQKILNAYKHKELVN